MPERTLTLRQAVYIAVVLACGSIAAVLAYLFRDIRLGSLPAGAAPVGVLGAVAAVCLLLAIISVLRSAGKRMDRDFAADPSARAVVGALTDLPLKQGLAKLAMVPIRYLPNRVSLVATNEGLELWGRPGVSKYAKVAWGEIASISLKKLPSGGRMSVGLSIQTTGEHGTLDIALAGLGVSGFPTDDPAYVGSVVEQLSELKASSGY